MKLPNGFGSVYKLKDKPRRKPWMAIRTMRWDIDEEKRTSRQVRKVIGYYATKQEAIWHTLPSKAILRIWSSATFSKYLLGSSFSLTTRCSGSL